MNEVTDAFAAFGFWDWACLAYSLTLALAGVFALRCLRQLPGVETTRSANISDIGLGLLAPTLGFGLIFPLFTQLIVSQFTTYLGFSQAHLFTAAFAAQSSTAAVLITLGWLQPNILDWAPSIHRPQAEPSAANPFRQALQAFSWGRVLLVLLAICTLGLVGTLLWKGIHLGWSELFLQGWTGQPPADEPQDIVDAVLKTDVDSWRFGTITLAVVVGAPLMEELAFRGMLYPALKSLGLNFWPGRAPLVAAILTGLLFSAAHLSPSAALPLFLFGYLMCMARDRFGLLTCIAIHASFNLSNLVWLKLAPNAANL